MIELSFENANPRIGFAGDTLNTAVYLRRAISPIHSVSYVTAVGDDPYSTQMIDFIEREGVSTNTITKRAGYLPGLYAINTATDGERAFHYWRQNSAARTLFTQGFAALESFDVIYFSGITLAILPDQIRAGFLDWLKKSKKTIVFDSNYRPSLWSDKTTAQAAITAAWQITGIGLPSIDDEIALFDEDAAAVAIRLKKSGVTQGAMKRGQQGPIALDGTLVDGAIFEKSFATVDTTAAGDSFNGGFLASYLQDRDTKKAMLAGHNCALKVIAQHGAIIPND